MALRQAINDYFQPSDQGVRKRDILREFIKQGGFRPGIEETAKSVPRGMARFAISAAEAPRSLMTGEATRDWYDTPVGRINSFQSEAANRVDRGDPMWKAMGNPAMDTVLAGSDIAALASMMSRMAQPGIEAMRGVNLRGSMRNPMAGPSDDLLEANKRLWESRKPFRISSDTPATTQQIEQMLAKRPGYEWGSGAFRYKRPATTDKPADLLPGDIFDMQAENPAAREAAGVLNRDVTQAIGVPQLGANNAQAIVPNQGRPVYVPEQGYGKGIMQRLFQGGINTGKYSKDNPAYIMSARQGSEYTRPSMTELAAAIRRNAPIVTDVASPDVGPLSAVDQGIMDVLQQAGYVEDAPGVWYPSGNFVNRNAFLKTMPKDIPMRPPVMPDESASLFDESGKIRTKDGQDFYQSNWIGDDYVPMFHKPVKRRR